MNIEKACEILAYEKNPKEETFDDDICSCCQKNIYYPNSYYDAMESELYCAECVIKKAIEDPEKKKGLYHKYDVFKAGTKDPVEDCIVLKFSDPLAQAALYTFAQDMDAAGYKNVADDVFAKIC